MPPFCHMCGASFYDVVAALTHYCIEGEVVEAVPEIEPPQQRQLT